MRPSRDEQRFWRRFWRRAPRRLRLTRAGLLVVGVALALGLAALNTGNNPLYFLWGALLGSIVVSGVLSEATLRPLQVEAEFVGAMRVAEQSRLALRVRNRSRLWPALATTFSVRVRDAKGEQSLTAGFVLCLAPGQQQRLWLPLLPRARGGTHIAQISAQTAYPFGFFVKERRFDPHVRPAMVRPERVAVPHEVAMGRLATVGGGAAQPQAGEDFFALRIYAPGDPLRRVLWRRVAHTGRYLVAQHQGERSFAVVLYVRCESDAQKNEHLLALAGSVAERLLQQEVAVGLYTHGTALPAEWHAEQTGRVLDALARLDPGAPLPPLRPLGGPLVPVASFPTSVAAKGVA